jgi:hypothetical protein
LGHAVGHAFVHHAHHVVSQAARLQHVRDRAADRDHAGSPAVLGARQRALEREVHAARGHQPGARAERARHHSGRQRVRVVHLRRVRAQVAQQPGQPPGRAGPQVAAEADRPHFEPGGAGAPLERTAALAGQDDLVAARGHALRGEQHLVLPSAPAGGGVDVDHLHSPAAAARARSASLAIFANV